MLQSIINVAHIIICLFLISVILLQQTRGGGLGGAFGGGAAQVFGGRGSANFMTRATTVMAVGFMITSMTLAYLSSAGDRAMRAFDAGQQGR
ncbi:MAG: preprotein translocase subunit SecG [Myxococcales bacterium]|nr:preprotein translocase subunit SecG [Myxococcales bacterium]